MFKSKNFYLIELCNIRHPGQHLQEHSVGYIIRCVYRGIYFAKYENKGQKRGTKKEEKLHYKGLKNACFWVKNLLSQY